jgi:Deacetylase PdaC/Protein of unknown function (DUF3298)
MKTFFHILFYLLSSFCAKSQTGESLYKVYTGKVGNLSATLHLHKTGKNYNGYIWFDQNQWPMPIYAGEQVGVTDSINISSASGPITLNLTGVFNNGNFTGTSVLQKEGSQSKKAKFELQVTTDKKFTPFKYVSAEDSAKLLPQIKNESTCDYIAATIWPQGNTTLDAALRKQISKMFNMPATVTEPGKWLMSSVKKSTIAWKKENSKLSPKDASDMGLSLSVQEENRVMVMYENEYYITLADYTYAYTGGAHGNFGTELFLINKETQKQMQLTDVLNAAGVKLLPVLLEKVARLQYGIKNSLPLDQNDFLVKKIEPSKNFYIATSGIGFLYAPYEIKSFADGDINLLIPFTALNTYLQPGFKH